MSKLVIAFCGQVRTPRLFLRSIAQAKRLVEQGLVHRVVVATWLDEIERHPDIFDSLKQPGFEVVGLYRTDGMGIEHSHFHQMRLLHGALRHIEADALVLKTRPDVSFNLGAVPGLAQHVLDTPLRTDIPRVFERRIWVAQFEASLPFYINDLVFLGTRHDVMQLCNFDMSFEFNNFFLPEQGWTLPATPSASEVRRFVHPFLRHFPLLEEYSETYHITYGGQPNRRAVLAHNYSSHIYWEYVSLYFFILHNYFLIGTPLYQGPLFLIRQEEPSAEGIQLLGANHFANAVDTNVFLENYLKRMDGLGLLYCNTQSWVDNIFQGKLSDPSVNPRILDNLPESLNHSPTAERRAEFHRYRDGLFAAANGSA